MNRRNFFSVLLGSIAASTIPIPDIVLEIPVDKGPMMVYSLSEWMALNIQLEIDYDMICRMIQVINPEAVLPSIKTLEELGYELAPSEELVEHKRFHTYI